MPRKPSGISWIRADQLDEKPREATVVDDWQLKTAERLATIETTQKQILHALENRSFEHRVDELETWQSGVNRKIAYVGGVIVTLGLLASYVVDWIKSNLSFSIKH